MSSLYKILFSVNFLHDYYANGKSSDFTVMPAHDCLEELKNNRLVFRQVENRIIVLAPVKQDGKNFKPEFEMAENTVFRFYLLIENPYFLNITNLSDLDLRNKKLYCSNQNVNNVGAISFLTESLLGYEKAVTYNQGSLVTDNNGIVFECLQKNPAGAKSQPLAETDFWKKINTKNQYVTENDFVSFTGSLLSNVLIDKASVVLEKFDPVSGKMNSKVINETADLNQNQSKILKLFSAIQPGYYKLTVSGNSSEMYVDSAMEAKKSFAVIEIFNQPGIQDSMTILDKNGNIQEKEFVMQFKNRSSIWKYNFSVFDAKYKISDISDASYSFSPVDDNSLASDTPIPITEQPLKTLSLKKDTVAILDKLKNPSIDRLSIITRTVPQNIDPSEEPVDYWCSEMQLTI
jgi:hypothetical protein